MPEPRFCEEISAFSVRYAMSFFGRVFVIGLFAASLVGWFLQVLEAATRMWRYSRQNRGPGLIRRLIIIAVLILSYFAVMLYRGMMGWRRTLVLGLVASISLSALIYLVNLVSPKIVDRIFGLCDRLIGSLHFPQVKDDAEEGIITLFLLGFGAAWLTFLLFAPFGVLCATGMGECGPK
jgi:hypothetical protein